MKQSEAEMRFGGGIEMQKKKKEEETNIQFLVGNTFFERVLVPSPCLQWVESPSSANIGSILGRWQNHKPGRPPCVDL